MLKDNRELSTTAQAAEQSGLSTTYLTQLLRKGTLEGFQLGREWLIYTDSFERFLAMPRKPGPHGSRKKSPRATTADREGTRIGAGHPHEYVQLDKETRGDLEQLLKLQQEVSGRTDLTNDLVMKRLIHDARVALEAAYAEVRRQAQETLRR